MTPGRAASRAWSWRSRAIFCASFEYASPVARNLQGREMVGVKTGIDVQQTVEALAEQACADQENNSHGQLNDDEVRAEAAPDRAGGAATALR